MKSIHHSQAAARVAANPLRLAASFALLAATAALVGGATCQSTLPNQSASSKNAGFTGDTLVTGAPQMQVATRDQVSSGSAPLNKDGIRTGTVSTADDAKIAKITTRLLESQHYARVPVDDKLSPKVFDAFVDDLDPQRVFFRQSDIDTIATQYRDRIVGMTAKQGDFSPAQQLYALLLKRADEQSVYVANALKDPANFTFTGTDTYTIDRKNAARPTDEAEAQALWKQRLRYEYLAEKLAKTKPEEITNTLSRRYERSLRSLKELDSDDIFELYMNAIAHALDPHTDYFGKASAETFAIQMRLSLFGIGATLKSEDGYTVIEELKPGPALKSKKLKPGDKIVGVAQGKDGAFVDVVDMKLNRVVEQIRGEKDTVVRLRYIPGDATDPSVREEVSIVRDEIKLEESEAKARLELQPQPNGKTLRVGVINLPLFYQDTEKGKSCSADVALLLEKLKAQNVDGVILDLRNNGGGSLPEAIKLTGLFIKTGPVVQVRDSVNSPGVPKNDTDPSVAYAGPLVVLTSHNSASASEIVTGALQDYGRAVVVGDSSSWGKGTVQAVYDLGPVMEANSSGVSDDPGQLKLTIQKFYRASGASTQLKGVVPDVVLPSIYDAIETGEKDLDNPLQWDEIAKAPFTKWASLSPVLPELTKRSAARVATGTDFRFLKDAIARVEKAQKEKTISLNEATRRKEQDAEDARADARQKQLAAQPVSKAIVYPITLTDAMKAGLPKPLTPEQIRKGTLDNADAPLSLTEQTEQKKAKPRLPEPDVILQEAERVLGDFVSLAGSGAKPGLPVAKRQ